MASSNIGTSWGEVLPVRRAENEPCAKGTNLSPHVDHLALLGNNVSERGAGGESTWPKQGAEYSTVEGNGKPLKVVYWNVAGIPAGDIDTFLGVAVGRPHLT